MRDLEAEDEDGPDTYHEWLDRKLDAATERRDAAIYAAVKRGDITPGGSYAETLENWRAYLEDEELREFGPIRRDWF